MIESGRIGKNKLRFAFSFCMKMTRFRTNRDQKCEKGAGVPQSAMSILVSPNQRRVFLSLSHAPFELRKIALESEL